MKDFFSVLEQRHTTRHYLPDSIDPELVERILRAAQSGPSAGGLQSYGIYRVAESLSRTKLADAADHQEFIAQAPVSLVFCADPERCAARFGERGRFFAIQDATIAAAYAQLAATALGLSSAWVGRFEEDKVRAAAEIAAHLVPVAVITIGRGDAP